MNFTSEEWRNLSFMGYGNYDVSNLGQVRRSKSHRLVKSNPNQSGVEHVGLYRDGIRRNSGVARLVAEAFLEIPDDPIFDTVVHRDGNLRHNEAENLEWRPHWFAVKYQREYHDIIFYPKIPVIERKTNILFRRGREAATYFCLLEVEVHRACRLGIPPTLGSDLIFEYEEGEH